MKRVLFLFSLACLTTLFVACSEENDTVEEFPNWQENNDKYFNALYQRATFTLQFYSARVTDGRFQNCARRALMR